MIIVSDTSRIINVDDYLNHHNIVPYSIITAWMNGGHLITNISDPYSCVKNARSGLNSRLSFQFRIERKDNILNQLQQHSYGLVNLKTGCIEYTVVGVAFLTARGFFQKCVPIIAANGVFYQTVCGFGLPSDVESVYLKSFATVSDDIFDCKVTRLTCDNHFEYDFTS